MTNFIKIFLILPLVFGLLLGPVPSAQAKRPKYLFKIASLAPDGSVWAKRFKEFAQEVEKETNGEVGFKIYPGGVMGDDRAMYRKMRIGQLHGGGFTMTGISEIVNNFRVLGLPFLFNSYDEVDQVIERLWPRLREEFAAKNLELLAMSEMGFIYTMSTIPITSLADLKKSKSWTPEGDPVSLALLEAAGVSPIPLSIPDVLTSLQTGLINTAFNSFYGSIVLQWFTRTNYITDIPFVYAYGAFVIDKRSFSRLPPHHAEIMRSAARKYFARLLQDTRKSNEESRQVLLDKGITILPGSAVTDAELKKIQEKTVDKLIGKAFSREIYETTMQHLHDIRNEQVQP